MNPYIEPELPQSRIPYLGVVPVRVDPGGHADIGVSVKYTAPYGTAEGTTAVKGRLCMRDIENEVEITINP